MFGGCHNIVQAQLLLPEKGCMLYYILCITPNSWQKKRANRLSSIFLFAGGKKISSHA